MSLSRRILLGSAAAMFGKGAFAAEAQTSTAPPVADIGAVLPLSGASALTGDEVLRGILLAADAVNASGGIAGKQVTLARADAPDQPHAAQAVGGLIGQEHVNILLGSGISALSYPASAAAELAQVPFIELTAPADGITARGFKYLLRTGPTTAMVAAVVVSAIQARFAGKTLGLLFNIGVTGGAIAAAVVAALNAAKLPVTLGIGYPEGDTDLHDQVGRLMRAKVDVLLHAAGPDEALALFQACAVQGWRPGALIGCGDGYMLRETAAALGSALDGTLAVGAPFYPESAAPVQAAYLTRFGMSPRGADSLTAYVGAKLVFDTLNQIGGNPGGLLSALRALNLPEGSLANGFGAKFDHSGQNMASFVALQKWNNGVLASEHL